MNIGHSASTGRAGRAGGERTPQVVIRQGAERVLVWTAKPAPRALASSVSVARASRSWAHTSRAAHGDLLAGVPHDEHRGDVGFRGRKRPCGGRAKRAFSVARACAPPRAPSELAHDVAALDVISPSSPRATASSSAEPADRPPRVPRAPRRGPSRAAVRVQRAIGELLLKPTTSRCDTRRRPLIHDTRARIGDAVGQRLRGDRRHRRVEDAQPLAASMKKTCAGMLAGCSARRMPFVPESEQLQHFGARTVSIRSCR